MAGSRSIVLSGFMATGKSTVGRAVAHALGLPFVDTDAVMAEEAQTGIGELFAREGEARFRDREAEIARNLLTDGQRRVIAFGGGTVTVPAIRQLALERAIVVTLAASPETVIDRATSLAVRPNLGARSPVQRARDLLALRKEAYAECHATFDTEKLAPDEVCRRIVAIADRDLVAVPLGTRSYVVELDDGAPHHLTETVRELLPSSLVIVTDENVRAARSEWLETALAPLSLPRVDVVLAPGEANKTITSVSRIWDEALAASVDRRTLVLAFGGGVVGDLAGFAASTLLRGVRCVQIATTLLAMVDSSVGGKTGFDHAAGKNLVGAFFQPSRVLLDLEHLTTLAPRERAAGLAEVVKIALARDEALLVHLETHADAIARGDRAALRAIVREAVVAKMRVVREDETEGGVRALLNLGHTVGHALEASGGYTRWLHGEAVAIGTVIELTAAERMGLSAPGCGARAKALLDRFALPTSATADDLARAWPFVARDKKRAGSKLGLPVLQRPGEGVVTHVTLDDLRRTIVG